MKVFFSLLTAFVFTVLIASSSSYAQQKLGDKASDFSLIGVDGNTYKLSDVSSDATVIMFWSTECPYVQPYTDRINSLAKEYSAKGVTFWAINSNSTEPMSEVKTHASEKGYSFMMLKDEDNTVSTMLGAKRTPEVFVYNKDKVLVYHGRIDDGERDKTPSSNDLRNALDEVLAGKDVTVKETKSFGCTIKEKTSK